MDTLASAVFFVGLIACVAGSISVLVLAFQESVLWGLARLLIPFAALCSSS